MQGKRAPSLHLWYNDHTTGDILTQDVCVPTSGLTRYTYYCCLCWNSGKQGGGYCGIQDHPNGRNFIFSIWDPIGTDQPIKVAYEGCGTKCERFGGEGTGMKTMNFQLGWKVDSWYTLTTRRWDENGHTFFGFWVHDHDGDKWSHLVTLEFPVSEVYFSSETACFLEDWMGSGENQRSLQYRNGFKRGVDGKWHPFDKATFNIVKEESSKCYQSNYDAGITQDFYYLQAGANTCPSENLDAGSVLRKSVLAEPNKKPISFHIELTAQQEVTSNVPHEVKTHVPQEVKTHVPQDVTSQVPYKVTWHLPESSVPQFSYKVLADDAVVVSGVDPQKRSCMLEFCPKKSLEIIIEDILGRVVSSKLNIQV